jgi:hypothetical protein
VKIMAVEFHTFDPDGDLILILSKPQADSNTESSEQASTSTSADGETHGENGDVAALNGESTADTAGQLELNGVANENGTHTDSAGHESSLEDDDTPGEKVPVVAVHMLVSSKHMMLASPVFKAMLQHSTFKEGRKLGSAGKVEVPLPDDNPDQFQVVLDIIHGRNRRVGREIDLDSLTAISIVVDKYQMAEAVESFLDGWIEGLRKGLPTKYITDKEIQDVHRWLGISWVFGKEEEFKEMTKLTERGCYASLAEDIEEGLPIPDLIVGMFSQSDCVYCKLK